MHRWAIAVSRFAGTWISRKVNEIGKVNKIRSSRKRDTRTPFAKNLPE
jgi:hypothetical protein